MVYSHLLCCAGKWVWWDCGVCVGWNDIHRRSAEEQCTVSVWAECLCFYCRYNVYTEWEERGWERGREIETEEGGRETIECWSTPYLRHNLSTGALQGCMGRIQENYMILQFFQVTMVPVVVIMFPAWSTVRSLIECSSITTSNYPQWLQQISSRPCKTRCIYRPQ
jgi:hypothetical protein